MKLTKEDKKRVVNFPIPISPSEYTNLSFTLGEILENQRLRELVEKELKLCDDDYGRHEVPADWNNISCTGLVEGLLQSLLDKAKGEKE